MNPPPLVSALIPNYNHGKYIEKCFAGLLGQSYAHIEILVTDDGSTDGSPELIRHYADRDPRVRATYFPKNQGVIAACKDLIARATGRYIYCGAADDFVVNKDFFAQAVNALESDPRPAGFYGVCGVYVAETEKLAGAMGTAETTGYNTPLQCCLGLLKFRSVVTSPSCIWRRDLYMRHGGDRIDELLATLGPQADYYINHEMAWRYGMYFERTPFACQRIFLARTNYGGTPNILEYAGRLNEMEKLLRKIDLPYPEKEQDWLRWRALSLIDMIKKSGVQL